MVHPLNIKTVHKRCSLSVVLLLLIIAAVPGPMVRAAPKHLTILTLNDLHGQLEPFLIPDADRRKSVGGFSRLAGAVSAIKELNPDKVLVVNTGDSLTGKYFLQFKGKAVFSCMSLMGIDVGTLGNHEFDRGSEVLADALIHCTFPLVVSNLKTQGASPLHNRYRSFLVEERNSIRIGIFGLITADLPFISAPGPDVTLLPGLADHAARTAATLRKQEAADLVVALTHIGLKHDLELAAEVPALDIICGGHSHDLLKTGEEIIIARQEGRKTIIVQAGARGAYLGRLDLAIDRVGITSHAWKPILMDSSIPDNPRMTGAVASFQEKLPREKVITHTKRPLDCRSLSLRTGETAIGNLITDIIRERFNTDIALQNGGGIRGDRVIAPGPVTTGDIVSLLPFENQVAVITLTGKEIRQVLEHAVSMLPDPSGGFLQVSGLRFTADVTGKALRFSYDVHEGTCAVKQQGSRILTVECLNPSGSYSPLVPDKVYAVAVNSFLAGGGDRYHMLQHARKKTFTYVTLRSALLHRLSQQAAVEPVTDGRIRITGMP